MRGRARGLAGTMAAGCGGDDSSNGSPSGDSGIDGAILDGANHQDGATGDGANATHDGAATGDGAAGDDGATNDGAAGDDGATDDGATDDGAAADGSSDDGSPADGAATDDGASDAGSSDGAAGDGASSGDGAPDGGPGDGGGLADTGTADSAPGDAAANDGAASDATMTDASSNDAGDAAPAQFAVGGTVSGLAGTGLVLQDNLGDNLSVSGNGAFAFPGLLATGAAYSVTVLTPPASPSQTCAVTNGAGAIGSAAVSNVAVACTTNSFSVGGTASGLTGTAVLLDNNGDVLTVGANGPFAFATPIASGATYTVTIQTQPAGQTCALAGASGTVGSGAITSVVLNCGSNTYSVGGTVAGLTGTLVLQDNGGDNLTLTSNGTFAFATPLLTAAPYNVNVVTQPRGETCTVSGGTGAVATSDVTSVAVTCTANMFTVGGTLTGLASGGSITLDNNGGNALTQGSNGSFTFSASEASGASFNVTIAAQPAGQHCTVSGGSGAIGSANVTSVVVNCAANQYTIGGGIAGLVGSVVLQDNGGQNLTLTADGSFAFPTPVASGTAYAVTVLTQPSNETCVVNNGTGTVTGSNVKNIAVTCSGSPHTIGGTLSGLATGQSVTLQDDGGNDLMLNANGSFVFTQSINYGATYNVTVFKQPTTEICKVTNGSGTVTGNVTNVAVACSPKLYSIGGNVQGLATGKTLTLTNNGGDTLVRTSNGQFTFATKLATGSAYDVAVSIQPLGETCTVMSGAGTVGTTNVPNVAVICH